MIHFETGKPVIQLDQKTVRELGIKKSDDIEEYRDKLPTVTFANVFNELMDSVPFSSNKHFSIYNNILIDIRNAKIKNSEFVEVEKTDLETLKIIFEKALINKPEINKSIGFMFETIDQCLADITNENNIPKTQ